MSADPMLSQLLDPHPVPVTVVRKSTSYWTSNRGIHSRVDVRILRKLTTGGGFDEEIVNVEADDAFVMLVNVHDVPDGLYQVVPYEGYTEWETGHRILLNYKLIPYKPELGETTK